MDDDIFKDFPEYNREWERYKSNLKEKETQWETELNELMEKSTNVNDTISGADLKASINVQFASLPCGKTKPCGSCQKPDSLKHRSQSMEEPGSHSAPCSPPLIGHNAGKNSLQSWENSMA